jgi:hypothetical protein
VLPLILLMGLGLGASSARASLDTVRGGQTALFVPFSNVQKLAADSVFVSPISPAYLTFTSFAEGPALRFPVSGGTVESDTMLGTVNHAGGMVIQKFNPDGTLATELEVTDQQIFNGNMLLGNVSGAIPAPSANLINATHSKDPATGVIHFEADAEVDAASALVLNTYFSTDVFEAGMILGRVKSDINTQAHVRPRAAGPLNVSLVPAYTPCTAPNRVHGPPLEHGSCAPPAQRSSELTIGTPDANGRLVNSVGSVQMKVINGDPLTSVDEADVRLVVNVSDVRRKADLADYNGELSTSANLRLTDRLNGSGLTESSTSRDLPFTFAVPCTPTADEGIGSECSVNTTADAVTPGLIDEGARAVWQLGQVTVDDGGPDGLAATVPNGVFAVQGVFVP